MDRSSVFSGWPCQAASSSRSCVTVRPTICLASFVYIHTYTHTLSLSHTHTHTYIYIYIYREREREIQIYRYIFIYAHHKSIVLHIATQGYPNYGSVPRLTRAFSGWPFSAPMSSRWISMVS